MTYKISKGIKQSELDVFLRDALKKYGLYNNLGVNFSKAKIAPIVMCTLICGDEILIVKRGYGLADAEGYWSTVNGFIDEMKPVEQIAQQEIKEELGLTVNSHSIKVADSYTLKNPKEKRHYIVFPCLITVKLKPKIVLDRENTDYKWIKRSELETFHILDDLPYAVDQALALKAL